MSNHQAALGIIASLLRCLAASIVMTVLSAVDAAPSLLPHGEVETRACLVWLQTATDAGMPDVRGATFWQGTWSQEPDEDHHPRADLLGFNDLHLHLRDGRWLMRGIYLRPAADPTLMLKPGFSLIDPHATGTVTTRYGRHQNDLLSCFLRIPDSGLVARCSDPGYEPGGPDGYIKTFANALAHADRR